MNPWLKTVLVTMAAAALQALVQILLGHPVDPDAMATTSAAGFLAHLLKSPLSS